jgi:ABC-type multidrug transport system fused ATPase/permease subunit
MQPKHMPRGLASPAISLEVFGFTAPFDWAMAGATRSRSRRVGGFGLTRTMLERFLRFISADRTGDSGYLLRVLRGQGKAHWKGYALVVLLMGVSAAATASFAYLVSHVINDVFFKRGFASVAVLCIAVMALFCAKGFATYFQAVFLARINNRINAENQQRMFDKLVQEGMEYFADRHSSHFTARFMQGASAEAGVLNVLVLALGRDLLSLIGLATVMIVQNPVMSLVGFIVMPPAVIGVRKLVKRVKALSMVRFTKGADILMLMQETLSGFRVVKAFNLEDEMRRRIRADIIAVEAAANKIARVSNRSSPIMEALGGVAIGLVLLYGGYLILQTSAPPGEFVSFIGAFLLAYEPAKSIARMNIDLGGNIVNLHILYELLDSQPAEDDDRHKPVLAVGKGRVEFIDVDFAYRPGVPVLRQACFVAAPGQVTALVGLSGGGKSTIFSLLLDFYRPQGGAIAIDGRAISGFTRKSVRASIAYVGQEPFLFGGTFRENIMCGKPGATEAEMIAAAEAANAHDFIMGFPQGYDAQVGEGGSQLSLGQRQRVAVARALIKDAPIVLLDEPTASLDSESEYKVREAIQRLCAGKTTLVIAHRLNTVVDADCIHVVERGAIVESGRHEDLLRKGGRYATFFRLQFPESTEALPAAAEEVALDPVMS